MSTMVQLEGKLPQLSLVAPLAVLTSLSPSKSLRSFVYWTNTPVANVCPTATKTNWPPIRTLWGLSRFFSSPNTAGPCEDQDKPLSHPALYSVHWRWWEGTKLTQWFRQGSVATRHRTGRGSPSWSAALLDTGRCRGSCPPGNTNSPRKQLQQTGHLLEWCERIYVDSLEAFKEASSISQFFLPY